MSNKTSLIITIAVAVIAVSAVIFTIVTLVSGGNDDGQLPHDDTHESSINPTDELREEAEQAARRLVQNNFTIFKLFYTAQFDKEIHFEPEPYGNESRDGFYTLREGVIEFADVEDLFALVDETFIEEVASIIKNDDTRTADGPLYKAREHFDGSTGIGVNSTFTPLETDNVWGEIEIEFVFESETEILLIISPADDSDDNTSTTSDTREVRMLKEHETADGWRLENIVMVYS
jgi:hypothetical protein